MGKIEVDYDEVMGKELEKRDRKIAKLEKELAEVRIALERHRTKAKALSELKEKVVESAYAIDSYYQDEGP